METLLAEIVADLVIEMQTDSTFNKDILVVKVRNAIKEVRQRKCYPSSWSEADIVADLNKYYSTIINVARYDYNQLGAEGERSHSESSVNRTWDDREKLFQGVCAFVNFLK